MESISPPTPIQVSGTDWLSYLPKPSAHDELFDSSGVVRPHWQVFLNSVRDLGQAELIRRWEEVKHLIRENGVTYNVYGDPRGMERPWQLDPIPLVIAPAEAAGLEAGLIQRGRLLERILADLYGPQTLLANGLVPPELVFPNPAFLRSCHGVALPGNRSLHLYAVNVGRSSDGTFWVLGDRTQSPSGAGYALENRLVLSRMLSSTFHDCRVQRLALFFRAFRDTLRGIAPHNRDNPRIALLTPGPHNETYFEHAYLARYLGYTLVEGGDLTVRDDQVFLKVLGGLQQVDVIFRRLDDDFCDPLELRADSFLGVPGLVQAVRTGNVAVANALGSGLLETTALLAFLPRLCRHLLGEELRLPSVPTWWCGDPASRDHVLEHLDDLVIKPALAGTRMEPVFGDELSKEERARLVGKIRARPRHYAAQGRLPLSTTPVLVGNRLEPRQMVLRAYLAASDDSFVFMPGGLTRVSASPETMVVSMQRGGGSKDTWVLSAGPVSTFTLLRPSGLNVELTRAGSDLPSRAADNLYWLGRYVERAEGITRLLRGILVRMTEKSGLADVPELPVLWRALTGFTECAPGLLEEGNEAGLSDTEAELLAVIHDTQRSGSLASVLNTLSRMAGMVRDRISNDMWRVLSDLREFRRMKGFYSFSPGGEENPGGLNGEGAGNRRTLSDELDLLNRTVLTLAAFGGLAMESVTRGVGWCFLDMGRKLERSLHLLGLVRGTLVWMNNQEGPLLEALLEIADSSMTYRRRYLGSLQTPAVLDLLLADETNPRSLAFQLVALADDVENLPRDTHRPGRSPEQRIMLSSLTALRLADVDRLAEADSQGYRPHLGELLGRLHRDLPALSEVITQTYLAHLQTSRHLASFGTATEETQTECTTG
jgi:uncharacterized circularly permuted ATP-grasp superfamily protein/uncharacterized alpha-E superfamily protein